MVILRETHRTPYMVHPGETKMYQDLKQRGGSGQWLIIAKYVALFGICQNVKAKHQRQVGLLKPLEIPMRKLENITMDFMVSPPRFPRGVDAIGL